MKTAKNEHCEDGAAANDGEDRCDSSDSSGRSNGGDDEENPLSYIDAAAAATATEESPGASSSSSSDNDDDESSSSSSDESSVESMTPVVERKLALAPFGTNNNFEIGDVEDDGVEDVADAEETIVFREDESSSPRTRSPRRANQEYYDVLERASDRLRRDAPTHSMSPASEHESGIYDYDSSGDEAVRTKKKKRKKPKKEKRRAPTTSPEDDDRDYEEGFDAGRTPSSMFGSLLPSLTGGGGPGDDAGIDPNDDLPGRWNPASLVAAARSQQHGGKTDERGFYKAVVGRAGAAYGRVRGGKERERPDEMPADFNLQSIRRPKRRSHKSKRKDIFWGSESIVTSAEAYGHEFPGGAGENGGVDDGVDADEDEDEDESDYNFSPVEEAGNHYWTNQQLVEKRRRRKERRRLGVVLLAAVAFLGACLGLVRARLRDGGGTERSPSPPQTRPNVIDDGVPRSEAPQRPVPTSPVEPVHSDEYSGLPVISVENLRYIVHQITPDASILSDPATPQSKAWAWAKEDMTAYNVEVVPRVAQRYALMTLYYATGGPWWSANLKWGHGHEKDWYGVGCETGEDNMISVTYLDLNSNNLNGALPNEIGSITSLKQIHLWGNNLVGSIPSTLSKLVNLHTLYLDNNRLDGEMADTFNSLKDMKHLDLSGNRLRGHVPHGLGSLSNLRDLRLSKNFLTGTFPTSLISLSNLQTLLLDSNAIGGSLPSLVGEMRSLVTIRIHENDLRGTIPNFADAERLEEAHFDGNYFTGTIPHFGSTRLRELYLCRNALTGDIPNGIGELVKLEIFDASSNELTGSIPGSMTNASALQFLDLSHNKLTGSIPLGLSSFLGLHELRLDHNRLSGRFPDWLGTMKHLELVHLNNNLLEGPLSLSLGMGDLYDLTEFAIENNDLHGIVGEAMCDLLLDVLTADCWGVPPRVDCPCCTECF